jgi:Hemerythrin HHE cation binding domain
VSAILPSLPPAFRVTDDDVRPGGQSMIDVLVDDHLEVLAWCDRLALDDRLASGDRATWSDRATSAGRLVDVLVAAVSRHLSAEEQYLYPTVREALPGGADLAARELAADTAILRALRRLHRTPVTDAAFADALDAFTRQWRRHVRSADRELLPGVRDRCTGNELVRLGNRVVIAREAAPTRPYPATPTTPPANKVVDPALGVLDKVRDVLTRRVTWPEDL